MNIFQNSILNSKRVVPTTSNAVVPLSNVTGSVTSNAITTMTTSGNTPEELLLEIPGSENRRNQPLFPIPMHLVGRTLTYIGELRQKDKDDPPIRRQKIPLYPGGTTTEIIVGPQNGFTKSFWLDRRRLMEESDFFRAIYGQGGKLCNKNQAIRCYDIPVLAMQTLERWLLDPDKCCEFDNRPQEMDSGVHILYVWRTADYFQMNGVANAAADIYHQLIRSGDWHFVRVEDFQFMYEHDLQYKPLFQWMLDCATFDYRTATLPDLRWDKWGRSFDMANDEDLVPGYITGILERFPQIATSMLYQARRQKYLNYTRGSDPMLDRWNGSASDTEFCRSHHEHLLGTVCIAPPGVPDLPFWRRHNKYDPDQESSSSSEYDNVDPIDLEDGGSETDIF